MSESEDILEEAIRITGGDRHDDYGDPSVEFQKVANMWSEIIGHKVEMRHVPLCMIALKICRECNKEKRDNLVDIAGYARVAFLASKLAKHLTHMGVGEGDSGHPANSQD